MAKNKFYETKKTPKTLLIGIHAPYNRTSFIASYFEEFLNLVKTAAIPYDQMIIIKLREIDSAYFFTKGKLEEVKKICQDNSIEQVILSDRLSPQQARNLEDFFDVTIIDRTDLILDIFEKAAFSAEGKTQVEIARLQHEKSRLAGKGIFMEQQAGITGLRGGFGEKAKERERRYLDQQIRNLEREIKVIQKSRATQRKQRISRKVPHVCLIGYTNAGKSTILNALTKSDVLAEDKLFATLDTTTRALFIDGKQKGIISDTVGFIQQLPHHLIEAFKSTLSELEYAHLLMQVIDISDPNWESHIEVVQTILDELDLSHKPMLFVFNKVDKVDDTEKYSARLSRYQPHVIVSALSPNGLKPLLEFLRNWKLEIIESPRVEEN